MRNLKNTGGLNAESVDSTVITSDPARYGKRLSGILLERKRRSG